MKSCGQCQQLAEWRYKDGWGVLACAGWFTGKCEGQPLDVSAPSGRDVDQSETYRMWVKMRLRELWPMEAKPINWTTDKPARPGWYWWRNLLKGQGPILVEVWTDDHGQLKSGPPAYLVERVTDVSGDEWALRQEA